MTLDIILLIIIIVSTLLLPIFLTINYNENNNKPFNKLSLVSIKHWFHR